MAMESRSEEGIFNWDLSDGKGAAKKRYRVRVLKKDLVLNVSIWDSAWGIQGEEKGEWGWM